MELWKGLLNMINLLVHWSFSKLWIFHLSGQKKEVKEKSFHGIQNAYDRNRGIKVVPVISKFYKTLKSLVDSYKTLPAIQLKFLVFYRRLLWIVTMLLSIFLFWNHYFKKRNSKNICGLTGIYKNRRIF